MSAKRTGKHARSKKAKAKVAKRAPRHVVAIDTLKYPRDAREPMKTDSRTDWKRVREMLTGSVSEDGGSGRRLPSGLLPSLFRFGAPAA